MAQQMSVKLSRSDASPWGFRLQGGKDFGSPLLIQKVNGGSPAERAGLQAGDAVIKVNNVEVFNMRHKEAQDQIVRAGNGFEITVQRGGSTWKPAVTPIGPSPVIPQAGGNITPVTKTSLAANKPAPAPIGNAHNYSPAPFGQQQMNGSAVDSVKSIVNKQYNTPVGMYSEETIAETLSAQAEVLAGGVLGVNFKKNERHYDPKNSEVFKMLNEIASEPKTPEPDISAGLQYFSHSSHAIGGRATSPLPGTPQAERMGSPSQRMVTFPAHRFATLPMQKTGPKFPLGKTQPQPAVKPLPQSAVKPVQQQTSVKPLPKTTGPAPKVVANNPPCNNCERVIVGGQKPAGAISAALTNRAPAMAPASPQPSNFAPMPFHAPGGFSGVKPSFNAAPPMKQPTMPAAPAPAPAPAPFTTPAKPAPASGKFVWPPKNPPEEEFTSQPTATPLYIPPGPTNQSAPIIATLDQSAAAPAPAPTIRSEPAVQQVQPFPQPYSEYLSRPLSAYRYSPKPLGGGTARPQSAFTELTHGVSFVEDQSAFAKSAHTMNLVEDQSAFAEPARTVSFVEDIQSVETSSSHHKKFSVCSQEVSGITQRQVFSPSIEQLSESIDTAILVSQVTGRPESPVPMEHMQDVLTQNEEPRTETTLTTSEPQQEAKTTIETEEEPKIFLSKRSSLGPQPSTAQGWQSPLVCALTTAPERPYSPFPSSAPKMPSPRSLPVSYKQLPQPEEGFVPIAMEESQMAFEESHSTDLVSALTIASDRPYSPLPQAPPPLPIQPVPLPEQTEPYHTSREEACPSPMISALMIAPQRPYSPFTVTQAPTSYTDTVEDTQANIEFKEPFNLPTPSAYSSMLQALTIAPDRPYSPLCVTQAPTLMQDAQAVDTQVQIPVKTVPSKILANVQPSVYKPAPVRVEVTQAPQPKPPVQLPAVAPPPPVPVQLPVIAPPPPVPVQLPAVAPPPPAPVQLPAVAPPPPVPVVQVIETQPKPMKEVQKKPKPAPIPKPQKSPEKKVTKQQKVVKVESQKTSAQQSTNALSLHRQSQQRPISPRVPRAITPSKISGYNKPATIPYYQQNIADGDFPCRSPRPNTPSLICPMTMPRTPTPSGRSVTPIPHKQLDVVRSLTPVQRTPTKQSTQKTTSSSDQMSMSASSTQQGQQVTTSTQQGGQVVVTRRTHVKEEFETFHKESTKVIERSGTTSKCVSQNETTSRLEQQSDLRCKEVTSLTDGAMTQREVAAVQSSQLAAQSQQYMYDSQSGGQLSTQSLQYAVDSQSSGQGAAQSQQLSYESQSQALNGGVRQTVAQVQPVSMEQNTLQVKPIVKDNFMSLEESQRASPLPFPNICLPEGMTYEVVDNKALYTSGKNKQVYKLSQPSQIIMAQKEPAPQFQAPAFKAPSIQKLTPRFEPTYIPTQPAQKFQPVAPQPPPAVSKPIQAPTATLPVHVMSSGQHVNTVQPTVNSFTPKSSGNGFQNFAPSPPHPLPEVTTRRASRAPAPDVSQGLPKHVAPAPGLMDPCTSPPNAGGGSAPKGGSVAGTSAPVRGRGILNQPGARQAMCASCHAQIRGPFVTALGKTWCPNHFICSNPQCRRELADIGFVEEKGQLYCEYCFEQFIAPACDKCSKKIKEDCLNAIGKHFHPECFACSYCGKLFGNNPFFLEDGMPYCQADWNELFTTKCFACGFPIEAGDRWVEALNNNYHSQCFNCTSCKKNLEGQSFFAKSGRPFCKAHAR